MDDMQGEPAAERLGMVPLIKIMCGENKTNGVLRHPYL